MLHVAILGAGFAGLSVAWHLLNYSKGTITIDLFDPEPIGGGASGISSGLLHPFAGKHAHLSWNASKGMKETHRLLTEASRAIHSPLVLSNGILRPAITDEQIVNFKVSQGKYPDETEWWDKKRCEKAVEGLSLPKEGGGLYIKNGLTINVQKYLQGLWQACALLGTQYHQTSVLRKSDLEKYDAVVIAMGPMTKNFPGLHMLPISPVKGQILELRWPSSLPSLPFSLVSQKYMTMSEDHKSCYVGATFEHQFKGPEADIEKATQDILPKIASYFPALQNAEIRGCKVGFRATSPRHLPLVGKVSEKMYFFTALGSKGLLYHAWVGKRMARAIMSSDIKHLPTELYYPCSGTQTKEKPPQKN